MVATLVAVAYPLGVAVVVAFGLLACFLAWLHERRQGGKDTVEFFLTARNSVNTFMIGWSFYAAAMGSWALYGPPSYAVIAGITGIVFYSVAAGIPILVVAFFGTILRQKLPGILSLSDYTYKRYGRFVQFYVASIMLLNMGIALTAEYTAVGDLFEYTIGSKRWPIVIIIGAVATLYTAYGGLLISIITDQWQALLSLVFVLILVVYVSVDFRRPLPDIPHYLGPANYSGLSAIAVMPISLISATIFSEAMWQRCWASADSKALKLGALLGTVATIIVVFTFAFGGYLAAWSGLYDVNDPEADLNTILFLLFKNRTWLLILVAMLSATMSTSAVDSIQNAITDSVSSTLVRPFFRRADVWWIRAVTVLLNIPPIIVSLKGYNVLQLFLLANLITTTTVIPLMAGLWHGPRGQKVVTPFSMMSGSLTAVGSLFWWAAIKQGADQTYRSILYQTFFVAYDYPPFMIPLGMSVVGLLLGALVEAAFRAVVPGHRVYPVYALDDNREGLDARLGVRLGDVKPTELAHEVPVGEKAFELDASRVA